MSEDKQTIKDLKIIQNEYIEQNHLGYASVIKKAIDLIQKQQNIINDMAKHIEKGCDFDNSIKTKEQIIDYFTNKYEEGKE